MTCNSALCSYYLLRTVATWNFDVRGKESETEWVSISAQSKTKSLWVCYESSSEEKVSPYVEVCLKWIIRFLCVEISSGSSSHHNSALWFSLHFTEVWFLFLTQGDFIMSVAPSGKQLSILEKAGWWYPPRPLSSITFVTWPGLTIPALPFFPGSICPHSPRSFRVYDVHLWHGHIIPFCSSVFFFSDYELFESRDSFSGSGDRLSGFKSWLYHGSTMDQL